MPKNELRIDVTKPPDLWLEDVDDEAMAKMFDELMELNETGVLVDGGLVRLLMSVINSAWDLGMGIGGMGVEFSKLIIYKELARRFVVSMRG